MAKIKKVKNKNPFLNPDGSFNLIEKFPGIDFMIYEEERIKKERRNKMPVKRCILNKKPGWKWGDEGKCYTYIAGDKKSEAAAKLKASKQGVAIRMRGGEK